MSSIEQGLAAFEAEKYNEAFEIFMALAEAGDIETQKTIAGMYFVGTGVEKNHEQAIKWYRQVAEKGDPIAQNNLGTILYGYGNKEEAIKWLIASAQQNVPFAQSSLGEMFSENPKEFAEAIKWYKAAAVQNFPWACHRLGEIYAKGEGVPKNEAEAVKWYLKAAENDYRPSQEILGNAYKEGLLGLPQDEKLSRYWLEKEQI
jgi:hypothetical protein